MKNLLNKFADVMLSKEQMKGVKGGTMLYCSCPNGNNFMYSTIGSSPQNFLAYAYAVCGSGGSGGCHI
jgi:natural product precursor